MNEPLSLEQKRAARRAAVASVTPTPPAPRHVPAPEPPKVPEWSPDDPVFYHRAVVTLAASLKPASLAVDDAEKAEALAKVIAKALCGGGFPSTYMTHKNIMVLTHQIKAQEELAAAEKAGSRSAVSEGEKIKIRARLEKFSSLGPIPTRTELADINKADLADLAHLSDVVRSVALDAILIGLNKRNDVTGARQDDALNVVVESIEHSLALAEALDLPCGEIEDGETVGPERFPYPANMVMEFIADAAANAQTGDDGPPGDGGNE